MTARPKTLLFRTTLERHLREELAQHGKRPAQTSEEMRGYAEAALSSVKELEARYLKSMDPVCVWDAIMQIDFASRVLNQRVAFPPWVLAYLISAAQQIMGRTVAHPAGDRQAPKPPTKNPNGTTTHYSDYFSGLSASQRREVLLEALGFKGPKGRNVLENAHRDLLSKERLRRFEAKLREGHSPTSAANILDDPQLEMNADRPRKIRRDRRKLSGEK